MENNSIIFLTLSLVCIYLILDAFIGKNYIYKVVDSLF